MLKIFQIKNHIFTLLILIFIININNSTNRELESLDIILNNLYKSMNQYFYPNESIIIIDNYNNKFEFNIISAIPIFNYSNSLIEESTIQLYNPKLFIYYKTLFNVSSPNNINNISSIIYTDVNNKNKDLSISITMEINFSFFNIMKFSEDNSFYYKYEILNNNSNSIKINYNYINNYKMFNNIESSLSFLIKKNFLYLYLKRLDNIFLYYPTNDGLFLFNKAIEYILKVRTFSVYIIGAAFLVKQSEIYNIEYEQYQKSENIISKFINVKIQIYYCLYEEIMISCKPINKICTIKELYIQNKNISFENILNCDTLEKEIIKEIFLRAIKAIETFL